MSSNDSSQRDPSEVMYRGVMGVGGVTLFAAASAFAILSIYQLITAGFSLGALATLLVVSIAAIVGLAMLRAAFHAGSADAADAAGPLDGSRQRGVLRTAQKYDGRLTLAEISLETRLEVDEARQILDKFELHGVAELQISDGGQEVYVFPAFSDDGRDKLTARSPLDEDAEVELLFKELAEEQANEQQANEQQANEQQASEQQAHVSAPSSKHSDDS
jgi:hypothetical protein